MLSESDSVLQLVRSAPSAMRLGSAEDNGGNKPARSATARPWGDSKRPDPWQVNETVEVYMLQIHEAAVVICHAFPDRIADQGKNLTQDQFYRSLLPSL